MTYFFGSKNNTCCLIKNYTYHLKQFFSANIKKFPIEIKCRKKYDEMMAFNQACYSVDRNRMHIDEIDHSPSELNRHFAHHEIFEQKKKKKA